MFANYTSLCKMAQYNKTTKNKIQIGVDYTTFRKGTPCVSLESDVLVERIFECLWGEVKTEWEFITFD